jgi:hypothetical protein
MTTEAASEPPRQRFSGIPVWPGSCILLLLVLCGLVVRSWAWVEMAVRFWLFQFIMTASGDLIGPQIHFTNLRYEFPFTVVLQAPELVDEGESFVMARRMQITLDHIPISGQPIQFSEVRFIRPMIRLIWKDDGTLVGLNNKFIKSIDGEQYTKSFSTVPSDFLRIHTIEIQRGSVQFEPFEGSPIAINDITTILDAQPEASGAGQYSISMTVDREPALVSTLQAMLDIDNAMLDIHSFHAEMKVTPETAEELPPDLKRLFDEYQVAGDMRLHAEGQLPFTSVDDIDLAIDVQLEEGSAVFSGYRVPIQRLLGDFRIADRVIDLESMVVTLVESGHLSMSGHLHMDDGMPFDVFLDMERVSLASIVEQINPDLPGYSGIIGLQGSIESQVDDVVGHLSGQGVMSLSDGDLFNVPIVYGLEESVLDGSSHSGEQWPVGQDRGSMEFVLNSQRIELDDIVFEGDLLGIRGSGEIGYDGGINFRFNAGPLEKLQMQMGVIGDVFGFLTDRLVTYQVTGTWNDPVFNGRPLGLGTGHRKHIVSQPAQHTHEQ